MPEQDPSRFEAFKETLSSAVEYTKGKTAIALMGATGLIGGGVIANQLNTEPASAANDPEATGSDLQQDCVDVALGKPKVWNPNLGYGYMVYPGDRRRQITSSYVRLNPTSDACRTLVTREVPRVVFKIQNPNNHKKWAKTKPQTLTTNDENGDRPMKADEGGIGAAGFYINGYGDGVKKPKLRYRCTPGKRITKAKVVYRMKVASAVDGHDLGRKSHILPVKIKPVKGVVLGGGVKRAC